jgi:hypothetical protein
VPGIAGFVYALAACYPAIRSVWLIGENASPTDAGDAAASPWQLMAFANRHTLIGLKSSTGLHRRDVRLSVVTDGNRFEGAWGAAADAGSLTDANWVESNRGEAFYSDPAARNGSSSVAAVPPSRRRAVCLWRSAATP